MLTLFAVSIFPLLMVYASLSDALTMLIPNKISILLVGVFLALAMVSGMPMQDVGRHFLCGFFILACTFTLFLMRLIGGGDAKLCAAVALWMGFGNLVEFLFLTTLIGAGIAILLIALRKIPLPPKLRLAPLLQWVGETRSVPYGIAIAASGLYFYMQTPIWSALVAM